MTAPPDSGGAPDSDGGANSGGAAATAGGGAAATAASGAAATAASGAAATAGGGAAATAGSGALVPTVVPTVQLRGQASSSNSQGSNPPGNANDGDLTTRWSENGRVLPVWWQLDLGASHSLERVEIVWEDPPQAMGNPYGYTIAVSDNATDFPSPPAINNTDNQNPAQMQVATFAAPTAGRYVRITVTSLPPNTQSQPPGETWASMYEVRVFGQ